MLELPETLPEITKELIALRKKPSTQERFKSYPTMLQHFNDLLEKCDNTDTLKTVLELDSGYFLLAGYRQRVIEKLLSIQRTAEILRIYAMQLMLFGDVDDFGETNLDTDARVDALHKEADELAGK
jgi:hypothetical protein